MRASGAGFAALILLAIAATTEVGATAHGGGSEASKTGILSPSSEALILASHHFSINGCAEILVAPLHDVAIAWSKVLHQNWPASTSGTAAPPPSFTQIEAPSALLHSTTSRTCLLYVEGSSIPGGDCHQWGKALATGHVQMAVFADWLGRGASQCLSTATEAGSYEVSANVTMMPSEDLNSKFLLAVLSKPGLASQSPQRRSKEHDTCTRMCSAMARSFGGSGAVEPCASSCAFAPNLSGRISGDGRGGEVVGPSGRRGSTGGGGFEGFQKLLAWVEVDSRVLEHNARSVRQGLKSSTQLMCVIKGNAFGHGLVETARVFARSGCDALGVDTLEDGILLRKSNVTSVRIVVLYWSDPWSAPMMIDHSIEPTVWDLGWVAAAEVYPDILFSANFTTHTFGVYSTVWDLETAVIASAGGSTLGVHIMVDSGLGREGASDQDAYNLAKAISASGKLAIRGLATHFCCPRDGDATRKAHAGVAAIRARLASQGIDTGLLHTASGGPAFLFPEMQEGMVRIGGLLFGIVPGVRGFDQAMAGAGVKPGRAIRWVTVVTQVKKLPGGWCLGYNCPTRVPPAGATVALLPLGSHDGFLEASGSAFSSVIIKGTACAVLSVDQNLIVIDVSGVKEVSVGDEVVLLGCDRLYGSQCVFPTLSTRIPAHLPRIFV